MEEQIIRKLTINSIVPARSWHYLYAYTNKGSIFIYAHRDRVQFFVNHEIDDDISKFQDIVTKLTAIKYFNEKSENCIGNLNLIDFETNDDLIIRFGTCLVTFDLNENFKADVWINKKDKTVEFHLMDAGEFTNNFNSEIILPDLKESERLASKDEIIRGLKDSNNAKLINLIQDQPKFFKRLFSFGFNFKEEELEKLKNDLDWKEISANFKINWDVEMVSKFSDKIDWEIFIQYHSKFWNEKNIEKFTDKINWDSFSSSTTISWSLSLIEKYYSKLSWINVSRNESIPWTTDFIVTNKNKLNIESLSKNKGVFWNINLIEQLNGIINWKFISSNEGGFWTEEFIERYKTQLDWFYLCRNPSLPWSLTFIEKYAEQVDWREISNNLCIPWTEEFIDKYKQKLSWTYLSQNSSFPWSLVLIEKYAEQVSWTEISNNASFPWTEEFIENNKDRLSFSTLSRNESLPWSLEFINKYADKWDWSNLGSNSVIPWTEKFIEDNLKKFQNSNGTWSLWKNLGLPQDESFWIKHKELLFPSQKGSGLMKVIDASNNENIPLTLNLIFELKENLDWNNFYYNIKKTGKSKILLDELSIDLFTKIAVTKHFITF